MSSRRFVAEGLQLVAIYAVIAGLYIITSDLLLAWITGAEAQITRLQTVKGLLFVAATTALLYALLSRMNRRIRAFDEQYRALFDDNPLPMLIYRLDNLRIQQVNQAAVTGYGYSHETFLQMTIDALRPAEDVPAFLERLEEWKQQGLALQSQGIWRHQRADGSQIWVEVHAQRLDFRGEATALVVAHDVTANVEAQDVLRLNAEVFEHSHEGIMVTDTDNRIMLVNRGFEVITGYQRSEVLGQTPAMLSSGRHDREFYEAMWHSLSTQGHWSGEIWNRRKDGSLYPEHLSISAVQDEQGRIRKYIGIFSDKSREQKAQEQIDFLANYDPLTQLPNRLRLTHDLDQRFLEDNGSAPLCVLMLDLDRFKTINDGLGYEAGNQLLIRVARRLLRIAEDNASVYRLSSDEFAILIEGQSLAQISSVAEAVLAEVSRPLQAKGGPVSFTTSIGIAMYPRDGNDAGELLQHAESALSRAKAGGRNTFRFFDESTQAGSLEYLRVEHGLRQALPRNELVLYYQPQFNAGDGQICGLEALIRWQHPEWGMVPPAQFIPVAEQSGQIVAIGRWVLLQAVRQAADWHHRLGLDGPVSVNISALEFHHQGLVEEVRKVLEDADLPPALLCLEITERVAMSDSADTINTLDELNRLGVKLAIDDFGTGYSSLHYLKRLPVDILKIDRAFIADITDDARDAAIVRAVVALAHSLGFRTVAEGVESAAQSEALKRIGCDELQGYHFALPLPAADCEALLATRDPNAAD